jgi:hypothetical protein
MPMLHWLTRLTMRKQHEHAPNPELLELAARVHRLEIDFAEQRERLDSLEGRHASLSASVRGRLGGRGNKAPPVPLMFPNGL